MSTVGERFKEVRKAAGCNQQEFAKKLMVSQNHISGIETGKVNPSPSLQRLLCAILGYSFDWITTGFGDKHVSYAQNPDDIVNEKFEHSCATLNHALATMTKEETSYAMKAFCCFTQLVASSKIEPSNRCSYLQNLSNVLSSLEQIQINA